MTVAWAMASSIFGLSALMLAPRGSHRHVRDAQPRPWVAQQYVRARVVALTPLLGNLFEIILSAIIHLVQRFDQLMRQLHAVVVQVAQGMTDGQTAQQVRE